MSIQAGPRFERTSLYLYSHHIISSHARLQQRVLSVLWSIAVRLTLLDFLLLDALLNANIMLGKELLGLESGDATGT
jgi:hypothetical protein